MIINQRPGVEDEARERPSVTRHPKLDCGRKNKPRYPAEITGWGRVCMAREIAIVRFAAVLEFYTAKSFCQ